MRAVRSIAAVIALAAVVACSDSAGPAGTSVLGHWVAFDFVVVPDGKYETHLTLGDDGRFAFESRAFGAPVGEAPGELTSYSRAVGSFVVSGDRLSLDADSLITWGSFHGADSPVQIQTPYPYDDTRESMRYAVRGDRLTLYYTTYPADAPVATTMVLRRVR